MPQKLVNLASSSPGFLGLNKQQSGDVLPPGWATEASNAVFDTVGRLAARKGTQNKYDLTLPGDVESTHEYIDGVGNRIQIFAANNMIFRMDGSTRVDITGTITTPTGNDWKFVNFNGKCVAAQDGHPLIVLQDTVSSFADLTGTAIPTNPDNLLAAFGRLWAIVGTDLFYSEILIETDWNNIATNVIDLNTVWRHGADEGITVEEFNGFLCVFGRRSIAIYSGAFDPVNTIQLVENIGNIGCIARDSIQDIGTDLLFLSYTGIRSLKRTIQEKSSPLNDISRNNRDYVIDHYDEAEVVKSAYSEKERFYLLSFPSRDKVFCFETSRPLEDGSYRMTEWNTRHTSYHTTYDSELLVGKAGYLCTYTGFLDDVLFDDTGGTEFQFVFEGPWNDFGEEAENYIKIPKRGSIHYFSSGSNVIKYKWAFDYNTRFNFQDVQPSDSNRAEYNLAEYSIAEYFGVPLFKELTLNLHGSGRIVKFGVEYNVDGDFALQRIDMQSKIGKLLA